VVTLLLHRMVLCCHAFVTVPWSTTPAVPQSKRSTKPRPLAKAKKSSARLLVPKEISWLSFNERVLQEADDERNPLLERIKFLGIFSNNLDEFYRVRVANLQRIEREEGPHQRTMGVTVRRLIKDIQAKVLKQAEQFNSISSRLFAELEAEGICLVDERHLSQQQTDYVRDFFQTQVRPRLVPIICHRNRELPALRDQFIYLAVELTIPDRREPIYAFIEVPTDSLSRFCILPRTDELDYVILLEDVIRFGLGEIFGHFRPTQHRAWTVKITRDSELELEEDTGETYVDRVHRGLRKRRTGAPVRMIYDKGLPEAFLKFLLYKMKLERDDNLIPGQRYHNFKDFMRFPELGREHLVRRSLPPITHPALQGHSSVFEAIAQGDVLLHYPYHGFGSFIDFLREAAIDPRVTHIRMTVYRVSPTSSVLNALSNAVRNGKQVTVLIELLARFDEENNLEWVDRLRDEGVDVITGVRGLKVHSKLCLVTRREAKAIVHYATIGTGNFNEETARLYTDHFLMTCDPGLTTEVLRVFEFFRNNYKVANYKHLVVSPFQSRRHWRRMIRREARNARLGRKAYVWIKLNNFADPKLINELYAASVAGVEIRLIVRSMFSLVAGIRGISENIEAVSLVGRYLEHSRFLVFCNASDPRVYITSGDWMPRNFDGRVEVACPIRDPALKAELIDYFQMQWEDSANARIWDYELSNQRRTPEGDKPPENSHDRIRAYLSALAREGH
jgi:polyphosphate kinase